VESAWWICWSRSCSGRQHSRPEGRCPHIRISNWESDQKVLWKFQARRGTSKESSNCCNQAITLIDPVVALLVPNDLAAIVTEIVRESLAAFRYRIAYSTDPSLGSAKSSPRLILLAFGVVGAHDVRKYSSACSVYLPLSIRVPLPTVPFSPAEAVAVETRRFHSLTPEPRGNPVNE